MKHAILIYTTPGVTELFDAFDDDERAAAFQLYWDIENDLAASGELVDSKALDPDDQFFVRRGDEGPVATPAPSAEVTESVTGYYVVDVASPERAFEIAARFPEATVAGGIRLARVWTEADFADLSS